MSIFVIIPIGILNIFIFAIAIISRNDYILNIFIIISLNIYILNIFFIVSQNDYFLNIFFIISLNGYIVYILPLPDASRKTPAFHSHPALGPGKPSQKKTGIEISKTWGFSHPCSHSITAETISPYHTLTTWQSIRIFNLNINSFFMMMFSHKLWP